MSYLEEDNARLMQEHGVLLRHYGELQRRCSAQAQRLVQEIEQLQGQLMRLRAKLIMRDSALAWLREDRHRLLDAYPAYPTEAEWLADSLRSADLVICQTGCVSHGAFWRVEDHCKRTGKTCVLVEQPQALRTVCVQPDEPANQLAPALQPEKDA